MPAPPPSDESSNKSLWDHALSILPRIFGGRRTTASSRQGLATSVEEDNCVKPKSQTPSNDSISEPPTPTGTSQTFPFDDVVSVNSDAPEIPTPTTSAAPSVYDNDGTIVIDGAVHHLVRSHNQGQGPIRYYNDGLSVKTDGKLLTIQGEEVFSSDGSFMKSSSSVPRGIDQDAVYRHQGSHASLGSILNLFTGTKLVKVSDGDLSFGRSTSGLTVTNPRFFEVKDEHVCIWDGVTNPNQSRGTRFSAGPQPQRIHIGAVHYR